jgi:hypothetical protein
VVSDPVGSVRAVSETVDVRATREAYDTVAVDYAALLATELADKPLDRALLGAFAEFHRVVGPGGHLLLAFQVGDAAVHLERAYGHTVSLDAYRLSPEVVSGLLRDAGLLVNARLVRESDGSESTRHAYLMACKSVGA